ncbi:hypothetical protein Fcan01_03938 [Folsomia candida]|uniref:Uncharacterized protein n=1 Tax=Folsomia candida TaxID=158441 RepID=A0A226F0Q4_FOLCA|nr:hypothetical protein Fcan01_03938 [Folsomia candida]
MITKICWKKHGVILRLCWFSRLRSSWLNYNWRWTVFTRPGYNNVGGGAGGGEDIETLIKIFHHIIPEFSSSAKTAWCFSFQIIPPPRLGSTPRRPKVRVQSIWPNHFQVVLRSTMGTFHASSHWKLLPSYLESMTPFNTVVNYNRLIEGVVFSR